MNFVRLRFENYRKFSNAEFTFAPAGITLITGPNGSGKSTILEAVYLLCLGKTPREVRSTSLLHRNSTASYFRVQAKRNGEIAPRTRSVSFLSGSAMVYHEGDKSIRRSELIGRPPVVLFSADEMRLVTGEPAMRRKWMDRILSQENPDYLLRLKRYTRTLEERNVLLRSSETGSPDPGSLMALDETLAADGNVLIAARKQFINDVVGALPEKLVSLGSPRLSVRIKLELVETAGSKDILSALIDCRYKDLAAGHTTVGPHRDDIRFLDIQPDRPALPATDILSQGEIRILSLALKCIEADRLATKSQRPTLLVDDLFSELDETRRSAVSVFLRDYPGQVLLTSCLEPPADLLSNIRHHITF